MELRGSWEVVHPYLAGRSPDRAEVCPKVFDLSGPPSVTEVMTQGQQDVLYFKENLLQHFKINISHRK